MFFFLFACSQKEPISVAVQNPVDKATQKQNDKNNDYKKQYEEYLKSNYTPSLEKTLDKWKVFTIYQNNKKICYVVSSPIETQGNHSAKRDPYIMVSVFGANKQEVSVNSGYLYKINAPVYVSIDGQQERFIAENEHIAFFENVGQDKEVIEKMKKAFKVRVFSESNAGTYSVDTYSLGGFAEAINTAIDLCK